MSVLWPQDEFFTRLVLALLRGAAMRTSKIAVALALAEAVKDLVPASQVYSVEKATLPTLPCVEVIAVTSERQETGPLLRHELSIEITVSSPTESGADETLDRIVAAARRRLLDAETGINPVVMADGSTAVCELGATR